MGKGAKPKVEVNLYYMSIHFGIAAQLDAIKRIIIKEKEAWSGYVTAQGTITINKPDLFGGKKKEGGAEGIVHWLPGLSTQVLPDVLATRLGRANGADAPGYRGLASAFFVGGGAGGSSGSSIFESLVKSSSGSGFYWTANTPYLPGVWIKGERSPKGLDQSIAMILRPGTDEFPFETDTGAGGGIDLLSADAGLVYQIDGTTLYVWSLETRSLIATTAMPTDFIGNSFGVGGGKLWAQVGPFFSEQLWSFDLDGTNGTLLVDTPNFTGAATGCTYAGGRVCFYGATVNEAYQMIYEGAVVAQHLCGFYPYHYFTDADDPTKTWCVGVNGTLGTELWIGEAPSASGTHITGTGTDGPCYAMDNGADALLVWQDGMLMLFDKATLTLQDSVAASAAADTARLAFNSVIPGASSIWLDASEYSTRTLAIIRTVDLTDWFAETSFGRSIVYDPSNHAIITNLSSPDFTMSWRLLDRGERDANPSHIIYECLTNTDWGMGSPSTLTDVDSFDDAAQTLFDEPLGLSMIWTRQSSIESFIQEVLDHIQGVLFVDPQTGLLTLKLIRGDYDPDDLPTIGPSSAELTNFGRKLWGEIVNEITVTWTNPDNEQDETVTAHDLASITTQGGIVSDSRNYYGVRSATVAGRLAARDLRSAGAPLATCEAEVDRTQWALRPASVLKLDWPEYGLDGVVMRVTSIDYGKPGDPALKLSLIEDVFGLDAGAYIEPPVSAWEDPSSAPAPLEHEAVFTMPLFFAANSTVAAFADSPEYPEVLAGVLGTTSDADAYSWELWDEIPLPDGTPEWNSLQTNTLAGYAELLIALDAEAETTFGPADFDNAMGQTGPSNGAFMMIGDGAEETSEIALITAVGTEFTVSRGVLDTVPRAWPIGTPVWFIDETGLFEDPTIRSAFEEVSYKFRTRTSQGLLALAAAPLVEYELTERPWLPNRPADVKAYGVAFSSADDPIDALARPDPWVTVEWANRNRLTEDSQVLAWTDATTAPETDQTTTILVLAPDETLLDTHDGLTGITFDVPDSSFGSEPVVILRTSSSRTDVDGTFESLQYFDHWVTVGFAGGTEASGGVGAFAPVGAAVEGGAFSGSGTGALNETGIANSSGAFSGSGTGALAAEGSGSAPTSFTALRMRSLQNGTLYGVGDRTSLAEINFKASGSEISKTSTTAFEGGSGSVNAAASNAFDDSTGTNWSRTGTDGTCYAGLRGYPSPVTPDAIELISSTGSEAPTLFVIEGSNDTTDGTDGTWYGLFANTAVTWTSSETKSWSIVASAPAILYGQYPAITGNDHSVGQTVTCSTGTWCYSPASYTYQWKRNGSNLTGETNASYTIVSGDTGNVLTCEVTATNATGSTTVAGGPIIGGETAHRYWRAKVTTVNGGGSFVAAAELEMRETAHVGNDICAGGTALADSAFAGLPASNAFDNTLSTLWACNGTGTAAYIGYDFGSGVTKNINEIVWTARNDGSYTQYPTALNLDYSDDGSSWTTKWSESSITFTQAQRQSFIP